MSDKTGEAHFSIYNDSVNISSTVQTISVYDYQDILLKENFENEMSDDTICSQWAVSQNNPLSGEKSLSHLVQKDSGQGNYFPGLKDSIDFSDGEYFFSFKIQNGDWDPAPTNCFYFSFISSTADSSSVNGYIAGVNAKGSTDKVSLWKIKNGKITDLIAETSYDWNEIHQLKY
jgi:hypothetical protein